jgi:hypothetical protein
MSEFIILGQCIHCLVVHGPFSTDRQRNQFYDVAHPPKCVGEKQVPKHLRGKIARSASASPAATVIEVSGHRTVTPASTERTYAKGDSSPAFPSKWAGSCYHCGFKYYEGDFIKMVTVKDGEKGKPVHEDCADELVASLWGKQIQSDEPPF